MSPDFLVNPAIFLIDTLFSLYIFALLLRFLFQWMNADYYNPISQFLIKITHPPLRVLRRFIPAIGRVDTASLVLMLGLQMLGGYLIFLLQDTSLTFSALAVWAFAQLLDLLFNIFFFAIIIRAVLSWVSPRTYNPAISLLYSLTEPLLRFGRRLLPPIGGIDLSPLIPLIGIQLAKMLVLPPLQQLTTLLN
ncbi:YggT family protein [Methylocaldum szegediense]|jgi:YggT family protein|uniref:YggT family protein n=1 Tax=Methylocaldum szegediense TaxID=73780 RepID=A0ABM9I8G6_9GAMM|nr:YggT family protein [Methylocaldum szegediense]CAI8958101.1 YggT family protein [Methylocaldum szegediense]